MTLNAAMLRAARAALVLLVTACAGGSAEKLKILPEAASPTAEEAPVPPPPELGPGGQLVAPSTAPPDGGEAYVCPMHPEVQRPRPGSCPKCGMTLVPRKGARP